MKTNEEKEKNDMEGTPNSPLFTGDRRRDTSVSEFEKAAEASQGLFNMIKARKKKKSK